MHEQNFSLSLCRTGDVGSSLSLLFLVIKADIKQQEYLAKSPLLKGIIVKAIIRGSLPPAAYFCLTKCPHASASYKPLTHEVEE